MALRRLDAELTRRGLARSREQARELIEAGAVTVRGTVMTKAATQVDPADPILVAQDEAPRYVSRGAHKLASALDAFRIDIAGRAALDAGASTGGFTQLLLERDVTHVIAVDVGYGQLAWPLRNDPRVTVLERTNVRTLEPRTLPYAPDLVVGDLSFISLGLVLPALVTCSSAQADLLLMVKPQFEVGREQVGDGVVRDPQLRAAAVAGVVRAAHREGLWLRAVSASGLPGPSGNVEYFVWLVRGDNGISHRIAEGEIEGAIARAVEEGPQ